MRKRKIISAVILAVLLIYGFSDPMISVYADDSDVVLTEQTNMDDFLTVKEEEENIERTEPGKMEPEQIESGRTETGETEPEQTKGERTETEQTKSDGAKQGNEIVLIENGKIIREDGTVEYGSPEEGQEYTEPLVGQGEEEAEYFDRYAYNPSNYQAAAMTENVTDMNVNIRKRTQWTDKTNGNGKVTLQYASDSGTIRGMADMNVILVQDKSGSMDANYGYNLEVVRQGWGRMQNVKNYPIQNSMGWAETLSDIANEGDYTGRLNYKDASSGYEGYRGGYLYNGEMQYNSPCQVDGHYYLMIRNDGNSGLPAWTMVHGNNLYNISATDLHHYIRITREQAVNTYLPLGRRVVRMTQGTCYTEQAGQKIYASGDNPLYFLDVSQLVNYNDRWILNTCAPGECQTNDRLAKSQDFMDTLVTQIQSMNPSNKIAYVPFWGDVPNNGAWSNASSMNEQNGFYTDNEGRMTYKSGTGRIGFTTNGQAVKSQIDHPFTYDGTNWSRALQNTIDLLNTRSVEDRSKNTLVIFLTDGIPQGTAGKPIDVNNPYINGVNEIANLKKIKGVTVYACGIGVNELDQTGLTTRLNQMDSTGTAVKARYNHQFEQLKQTILNRINQQYAIDIKGQEAFYTDTLNAPFALDEGKVDKSWKVLASPGNGTTKGVPTDVYNVAKGGAKAVYVRSTKTVYWYIGAMTNGSYTTAGHEISFPIRYADYQTATNGADKVMKSNTVQKITYVTTQNPNQLLTKSMDTPSIIFNRQENRGITVNKNVTGAFFTEDKVYRFVYSKKEQNQGKVTGYEGEVNVTVKAGETSGSAVISKLDPGTYYVYEVDQNDHMVSPHKEMVKLTESAELTTVKAGGNVPLSSQTSDGSVLSNLDNVLRITTKGGAVSFLSEYVKMDVEKVWEDENFAGRPKHVTVRLLQNDVEIQSMELSEENGWKGTFVNLEKYAPDGSAYQYDIAEDEVTGYETVITRTREDSCTMTNHLLRGSIKLKKLDADRKTPLAGVSFELKHEDGRVVAETKSNEKGEVIFENLYPDRYIITETKTTEGHTLLKESLIVEVPMKMTEEEIKNLRIDKDACIYYPSAGVYLLYDHNYEITNHAAFVVPMTGGRLSIWTFIPMTLGMLLLVGIALFLMKKRK